MKMKKSVIKRPLSVQDNCGGVVPVREETSYFAQVQQIQDQVRSLDQKCGGGRRVIRKTIGS